MLTRALAPASAPALGPEIAGIVDAAAALAVERWRDQGLEALVLAGSLARGEGSLLRDGERFRLLGDAEFLAVVEPTLPWSEVRRRMAALSTEATERLGGGGRLATIEYTPAGMAYLRRNIRPCMFAYDLRRHGAVVWGRSDVLEEIAPFGVDAIPGEDALELVMNRVFELVAAPAAADEEHGYRLVKTVLDLAGAALCFAGRYVSSYAQRPAAFRALLAEQPELREALASAGPLEDEVERAARLKLEPSGVLLLDQLERRRAAVLRWARALWLWQLGRLVGRPAGDMPELLAAYLRRQGPLARLRGWAKYLTHPLRPARSWSWPRAARLGSVASPRRLVYAAGLLAWQAEEQGSTDWVRQAAAWLPGPVPVPADAAAVAAKAQEIWQWLIRNN